MVKQISDFATFYNCTHPSWEGGAKWRNVCYRKSKPEAPSLKIVPTETSFLKASFLDLRHFQNVNPVFSDKFFRQRPRNLLKMLCLAFASIRFLFSSPSAVYLKWILLFFSCLSRIQTGVGLCVGPVFVSAQLKKGGPECGSADITGLKCSLKTCGRFLL
ncbi:hypothetical protein [Microbulbifer variabilis]|uniref:hypothetical protein n=1 Tax=Microbulbifer variabilis TaxID=266805 RepID=UPI001CFE80B3|nr:hypothetical protein [Microbulbifer variabilis]